MNVECVAVIPARISSTRLKDKPLIDICGKSLIQRVYENAVQLKSVDEIVVATDSEKVAEIVRKFNARCELTPPELASGSDRVYYTVNNFFPDARIIVNIQGDEPFISTELIDRLVNQAEKDDAGLYSAYFPVSQEAARDTSVVKVATSKSGEALYFSRSLIPHGAAIYKKHLGIYVWKKELLEKFYNWGTTELERAENLEQLRILDYGYKIKMVESLRDSLGIDTPSDLEAARKKINEN